jgi:hypothetical protein
MKGQRGPIAYHLPNEIPDRSAARVFAAGGRVAIDPQRQQQ